MSAMNSFLIVGTRNTMAFDKSDLSSHVDRPKRVETSAGVKNWTVSGLMSDV